MKAHADAVSGDLIDIRLRELHPTQPSLGYDEVYYRVGRYILDSRQPVFDTWCVANGQGPVESAQPDATIADRSSFTCTVPVGAESPETTAGMKTAVIGPGGTVYLTDGHHTLTSFWEVPGGGPAAHIRVRVVENLKHLEPRAFWQEMGSQGWTWLRDADGEPTGIESVPKNLGLNNFADDRYRGVMFFLRDISYFQDDSIPPFQEFYWGYWLRGQTDPGLRLENVDLTDASSYIELLRNVGQAMVALPDDADIGGRSAIELGKLTTFAHNVFDALDTPLDSPNPGKLSYSIAYKAARR